PVMLFFSTPMVLVTRKDLPAATLKEFVALFKTGKVTMGNAGIGSIAHLTTLLFESLIKTPVQQIPYRGLSQAMNDLLAGQIDAIFDQVVSATPHIASKSVKPIVVTISKRSSTQPDIPSSTEAGLPDL